MGEGVGPSNSTKDNEEGSLVLGSNDIKWHQLEGQYNCESCGILANSCAEDFVVQFAEGATTEKNQLPRN